MSINLLDMLKSQIGGDVISQAAKMIGESETGTQSAMNAILPTLLGSVVNSASTTQGATGLMNMLKDGGHDGSIFNNLAGLLGGGNSSSLLNMGGGILNTLLGDKIGGVASLIANFAGIKSGSASSLMSMAAPLIMGVLGKQVTGSGLGVSGLANLLMGQSGFIKNALPAGLSSGLGNLLGFADLGDFKGAATNAATNVTNATRSAATQVVEETSGGMGWLPWILGLALAGGLLWYFMKGCNPTETVQDTVAVVDSVATEAAAATAAVVEDLKTKLPDGTEISFPAASVEDNLVKFIADANAQVDKKNWINFEGLNFETGKATLMPGAETKLNNIVAIMKAYPAVKLKIGGYTDNVGNAASNQKLSDARAKTVMGELVKLGVAADRLAAEGYGQEHPVCPTNDTDECKAKNRRIDVNVTAK